MRTIMPVIVCMLLLTTPTWAQNVDRCVPGDGLFFDVLPITRDGYVLVPARQLVEWLGGTMQFDGNHLVAWQYRLQPNRIDLWVGSRNAKWNDTDYTLDTAPVMSEGRLMVPMRFVGEAFGCRVDTWDHMVRLRFIEYWQKAVMVIPPPEGSANRAVWKAINSWYRNSANKIGRQNRGIRIEATTVSGSSARATVYAQWEDFNQEYIDHAATRDEWTLARRGASWRVVNRTSSPVTTIDDFPY